MKRLVIGILAHVDSGKTTLSEAMLYRAGALRKLGRGDHRNAFLDTDAMERERGITIFSKQAILPLGDLTVTLLDTPGHVDFSSEMERTLQVLDYAILVISGSDGIQGHTLTLWRLLARFHIPAFLFLNKMDLAGTDRDALLEQLRSQLSEGCVDFTPGQDQDAWAENVAVCDEGILAKYLEEGDLSREDVISLIRHRKVFPCYFGSALKLEGVDEFLQGLQTYALPPAYPQEFGARVFKIARDPQGGRLTYLKVTGGQLRVKALLTNQDPEGSLSPEEVWQEKADQLRIYSGAQFKAVDEQEAEKIKTNVQEAIRQIYGHQLPNGGFVYWPGNAAADEWISSYAGMFLTLAQEKGYAVHANVLNKWKRFQRAAAQNWRMPQEASGWQQWQSELQQAFRLYTLALAGVPEYGAMNRMKEQTGLSIQAKWRLAAAYALTGKMKPAEELVYNVETTVNPYSSMNQIYGSSDRDEAMILETLILMNRERDALQQAKVVSKNLSQEDWFSTQSTAFALMAMGRLAEKLSGTLDFVWSWNDKQQPAVKSAKAVFEKEIATTPKSGTVSVKNQGKGALSVDLITRTQLLNDTLPAISDNLRMDIRYANLNGTPLSVNDIIQGTDFMAITSISNISGTSDYTNLALTHIIPSGWEIYNERMVAPETENAAADGSGQSVSKYSYQDIRDDRVLTYFNLRRGETKVFTVRLQATYAGNFILPAVQCEAMYDVNVQARSKAGRTTVSR